MYIKLIHFFISVANLPTPSYPSLISHQLMYWWSWLVVAPENAAPPIAGCTPTTQRPRGKRYLLLWTHWILSCYFFQTVLKMAWQDAKSWCWRATGEDGWTAVPCCLSSAPPPQVWGVALGERLLLPPPLCLCIREIWLCVHIFITAKLSQAALARRRNLATSFVLLTVFAHILLIYLF